MSPTYTPLWQAIKRFSKAFPLFRRAPPPQSTSPPANPITAFVPNFDIQLALVWEVSGAVMAKKGYYAQQNAESRVSVEGGV